jgi:hypothetical protein
MPGIRIVPETVACESTVRSDIEAGVAGAMPQIVEGLTKPLSQDEKSPKPKSAKPPRIAFKGTLEEVNRHFYGNGWTDGLPIIPPTEARVAEMMQGTDLPPGQVVAKVIPRLGKATVEKIAINAVMAGALPTHLPFLIAAVQAVSDPKTRFDTFEVSTGSWAPFFAVNGPYRSDVNINCSSGALSPGNIANSAMGRALGLIVKNIGGARKAVEDMGVLGNPAKWSLVVGELEEESPWESLSVERGFKKEDSTLTVFFPNTYIQTIPGETNANGILDILSRMGPGGMSCLMVIPSHAKILSSEGWTKKKVKEYIAEHAVQPFQSIIAGSQPTTPRQRMDIDNLMILVAGGPGAWMGLHRSVGGFGNALVTKKLELPKNWDKLVAKYKSLVPDYEKY